MMIINSYRFGGGGAPPAGLLLDDYPNAVAAYSLDKLRTAYAGAAIRVRESGGNTETDIGFSGNVLDTAALLAHCGGNDGFVTIWYDQSVNGHNFTQTTIALQPKIVNGGVLIVENGKPAIEWDNTLNNNLELPANVGGVGAVFSVHRYATGSTGTRSGLVGVKSGSLSYLPDLNAYFDFISTSANVRNGDYYRNGTLITSITSRDELQNIMSFIHTDNLASFAQLAKDRANTGRSFWGKYQELIMYGDRTVDRLAVETEINARYGIY